MSSGISRAGSAPCFILRQADQQRLSESVHHGSQSQDLSVLPSGNQESQDIRFQIPRHELPQQHYYTDPIYQNTRMLQTNINTAVYQNDKPRSNRNIHQAVYHNVTFKANCRIQHNVRGNRSGFVGQPTRNRAPLNVEEVNRLGLTASSESSEDEDRVEKSPEDDIREENASGSPHCVDRNGASDQQLSPNVNPSVGCEDYCCSGLNAFCHAVKYILILVVGLIVGAGINSLFKCLSKDKKNS